MHTEMIGNRPLSISMLLNGIGYLFVPFAFVSEYTLREYFVKRRTVCKTLALGYLRNILVPFKMIGQTVDKIIFPED